jgi:hypothetical protein
MGVIPPKFSTISLIPVSNPANISCNCIKVVSSKILSYNSFLAYFTRSAAAA